MKRKLLAVSASVFLCSQAPVLLPIVSASPMPKAIQQGSTGQSVVMLQQDLNLLGYSVGPVDGNYGPLTAAEVAKFQRAHHVPVTQKVDAATWQALLYETSSRSSKTGTNTTPSRGGATSGGTVPGVKSPRPPITALRQTSIYLNNKLVATPYAFTSNGTTFMPIWYLKSTLATLGIQTTWNGKVLALTVPPSISVDLGNIHSGTGAQTISINGTTVTRLSGISYPDVYSHKVTAYMPIWHIQRALLRLNVQSNWNGHQWTMTQSTPLTYIVYSADGSKTGTYSALKDAESAAANMPGAIVKDSTGKLVFTGPPSVTFTVYAPAGAAVGNYPAITDAKTVVANIPGGTIKDSTNKLVFTQTIPYVAYAQNGELLGLYAQLTQAETALVNYPGAVVRDSLGQVVYTESDAPQFGVYTATGSFIGKYAQLDQAESALANNPAGTVRTDSGNVIYTQPDNSNTVTYFVYSSANSLAGSYGSLTSAESVLSNQPAAFIKDSAGNVLYIQPILAAYYAYSSGGGLIGLYNSLGDAEQALALYPGGIVKDHGGNVVFTEGGGSQGGQPPGGGTTSGKGFSNVDLRYNAPGDVTAGAIDTYLTKYGSPLAGLGQWFMSAQAEYGVDANYLVSHAILESTWGKSPIALSKNNIYGYGAYDSNPGTDAGRFPSLEYAILYQAWAVRHLYLNPGASLYVSPTLTGMNVNYATDPNWASSISLLMGQLATNVGDSVASYQQFTLSNVAPTPVSSAEPIYNLNGAKAVIQPTPNYGYLPYYSNWTTGQSAMYVRPLQWGNVGGDVATLQQALNQQANAGLTADGDFGPLTKAAVTSYQKSHGLTATGTCDYTMWSRLVPAPANRISANSVVTVDAIAQGLAGGLVVAWYHIANSGWVDSQYVHFTNVYRLTVASPTSPTDTTVPVYSAGNTSSGVATTMHAGDFVVASSPATVNGFIEIQIVNERMGQPLQGWINASKVSLTAVQ